MDKLKRQKVEMIKKMKEEAKHAREKEKEVNFKIYLFSALEFFKSSIFRILFHFLEFYSNFWNFILIFGI